MFTRGPVDHFSIKVRVVILAVLAVLANLGTSLPGQEPQE
jgi:hypothetical protein